MPRIPLGQVVGRDASAVSVQKWLGKFVFSTQDALVRARYNIDIVTGGAISIDSVPLEAGNVVLLTGQTDKRQNGLYVAAEGPWARLAGYGDANGQAFDFTYVVIERGPDADKIYAVGTEQYAIGQDEIEFIETAFSSAALPGKVVIRDRAGMFAGSGSGSDSDGNGFLGMFGFRIGTDSPFEGHLLLDYMDGQEPPAFSIAGNGHLILTVNESTPVAPEGV